MKLTIGMPSLIECKSTEENLLLCKDLGLNFVEINMNMIYNLPENNSIETLRKSVEDKGLFLTMHFPEEIDFGSFYQEITDGSIALFKRYVDYGSKIGVKKINLHLQEGARISLPTKKLYSYEMFQNEYTRNLIMVYTQLVDYATKFGIEVCVENVTVPEFLKQVFLDISQVEGLHFTYDIGHDARSGYAVNKLYHQLGDKVTHMHLHDFNGENDHQPLFTGILDLKDRLEMAEKNQMTVVVEVKSIQSLTESIIELKKRYL